MAVIILFGSISLWQSAGFWPVENFWLNITRLAIILFTGFIAWTTYRSHLLLKDFQPDFNLLLSVPETIVRILLIGVCLFLAWLSGLPAVELGLTVDNVWRSVALGFGVGIIVQLGVNLTTLQFIKRFGRDLYSPWLIRNIMPHKNYEWLLIALAFIPPIVMEELLFRSLWLGTFQTIIPLPLLIIGTSIVFGFMHQPQGKLGMIMAGSINIIFSV
ncbi:MAG: CPBP family intramembrane metalloprotease, partial [Chloroflexi bacterium]|nr:CPBP family intramembrane metalloprotease [Chloroflexota bacterium]